MWTRSLLKENAKNSMKNYYWTAFGVCFLTALLGGNSGNSGISFNFSFPASGLEEIDSMSGSMDSAEAIGFMIGFLVAFTIGMVFAMAMVFAVYAFLGGPIEVGKCHFFYEARNGNADFGSMFASFGGGRYMPTVKIMFFKMLYTWLWSLLFVIPGIIKAYEYYLIPYLIAENPNLPKERAFEISKRTMNGEKWDLFVLELSFIGWQLLGLLACCVGSYFIAPYAQATYTEFYACMRAKMIAQGITTEEELTGVSGQGFTPQAMAPQNPYDAQ